MAPSVLWNARLKEVVLECSGSGSRSLWSELTPSCEVDGFLRFSFAESLLQRCGLESHVPGAEGPVPLLHLGRPHPDRSEALQRVTQSPGSCELTTALPLDQRECGGAVGVPASESG